MFRGQQPDPPASSSPTLPLPQPHPHLPSPTPTAPSPPPEGFDPKAGTKQDTANLAPLCHHLWETPPHPPQLPPHTPVLSATLSCPSLLTVPLCHIRQPRTQAHKSLPCVPATGTFSITRLYLRKGAALHHLTLFPRL